ncbi:MAG: hypothetical protein V1794_11800 [Candidatus Glassbacteria bacterium]
MKMLPLFLLAVLSVSVTSFAQLPYNFTDTENDRDIQAYWYNVYPDSLPESRETSYFGSSMQVYCKVPADTFRLRVETYLKNGEKIFDRWFRIEKDTLVYAEGEEKIKCDYVILNGFLSLGYPVTRSTENPERIAVTLSAARADRKKEIKCRYYKLYGWIKDFEGRPFRAALRISPDFFGHPTGGWSDSSGYYEILLPERTYNSIYVDDQTYGIKTLEAWGWHIIMDSDQRLDFKVGTAEVYNLHAWPNNGGVGAFFISFRPMALIPLDGAKNDSENSTTLNGKELKVIDIAPALKAGDIRVKVNGREAEIYSLQKYYETGRDRAMPAYLIQVRKQEYLGKVTFEVEYQTEMEISGQKVFRSSMGYCQIYLKYGGMSELF